MAKKSSGILWFRRKSEDLEVFLVHPGGPFWQKKDDGAWSIPKGEFIDEEPLAAAQREVLEETGVQCSGDFLPLGDIRQAGGKIVYAWALEFDFDPSQLRSNTFELEWPPKSGTIRSFPEVDRGQWFGLTQARTKILKGQCEFLERLLVVASSRRS